MIRSVVQIGDLVLNTKAKEVADFKSAEVSQLIDDMIETMRSTNLVGIAAPQVGESLRIFVTEIRKTKTRDEEETDDLRVFINPEIVKFSRKEEDLEGCGSVGNGKIFGMVKRPEKVVVQAFDCNGKKFELAASGLLARVIQHEYDHIEGILFIEKTDISKLESYKER